MIMKKCPKCNFVFEDDKRFCPNDGTELIAEQFPLPSEVSQTEDEEQTVVRVRPIPADESARSDPVRQPSVSRYSRLDPQIRKATGREKRGCLLKSLILIVVVAFGVVVTTGLIAGGYFYFTSSVLEQQPVKKPSSPPKRTAPVTLDPNVHAERNLGADESTLNARVIVSNAAVRSAAGKSSKQIAVLPRGDRLRIIERRSPVSAWYRVECEHGIEGWMHGNSIEYVD